jgi:hypothetical protein
MGAHPLGAHTLSKSLLRLLLLLCLRGERFLLNQAVRSTALAPLPIPSASALGPAGSSGSSVRLR